MLICKYTRLGNAVFVPHLDMLRAVTMGIRRAGIKAEYSEGFNPHMKIFFGQPLPIGTESECEYFCVYAHEEPHAFMEKLSRTLPEGVKITAAAKADKDPNVAKIMCFADYTVTMRDIEPDLKEVEAFCGGKECVIEYVAKGETRVQDVKSLIISATVPNRNTVKFRLCCGNKNLRAERLMGFLSKKFGFAYGYDIRKTAMYDLGGNNLDKILFGSVF